jgi:hypothetical protein
MLCEGLENDVVIFFYSCRDYDDGPPLVPVNDSESGTTIKITTKTRGESLVRATIIKVTHHLNKETDENRQKGQVTSAISKE